MILLNLDPGGNKAATIEKPDITKLVFKTISKKYSDVVSKRYAELVSTFLKDNMKFPKDGIYKIEDERFVIFNPKTNKWKKLNTGKSDYVISSNSDFWTAYDSKFPFLNDFRHEIEAIICNQTTNMFEEVPTDVRYIEVNDDKFVCKAAGDSTLWQVLKEYMAENVAEDYACEILKQVFNATEYPIFIIKNGITQATITCKGIKTTKDLNTLQSFLNQSFLPKDAEELFIRVRNILIFGKDLRHYMISDSYRNGRPVYKMSGLSVVDFGIQKDWPDGTFWFGGILLNKENLALLEKILNDGSHKSSIGAPSIDFDDGISSFNVSFLECNDFISIMSTSFGVRHNIMNYNFEPSSVQFDLQNKSRFERLISKDVKQLIEENKDVVPIKIFESN